MTKTANKKKNVKTSKKEEKKKIIEKNDPSKNVFSVREIILVSLATLIIGFIIGILLNKTRIITKSSFIEDEYLNEFAKNYQYIVDNYYEEVDKQKLINGAIEGMTNTLDEFSTYMDKTDSNNFSITLNGRYDGIGVQIAEDKNKNVVVISVFKNSPSDKAGIKPGDILLSINGKDSKDLGSTGFVKEVKNSESKELKIKYKRDEEEKEVTVVRSIVELTSVKSETYNINDKKVGYIYMSIFANNTYSQFKKELDKLEKDNIDYLIIDVRGNTGGHLTSIDSILDLFLNKKHIMYQFDEKGKITKTYGKGNENKKYKIILLGNEDTASASEVLIASLKENLNSIFIGNKTYGKGTVQELKNLKDGNQYKITIKKWLTPKGNWINDTKGIKPDIEVDLDEHYFETYEEADDTQLQRALNYIRNGE